MSSSPHEAQEEPAERHSHDEVEEPQVGIDAGDDAASPGETLPMKRSRGRPLGSKNKKTPAQSTDATPSSSTTPGQRKRGRPRKTTITDTENQPKPEESGDGPPVKRSRGRPRKNPQPTETADAEGSEPAQKKKRGRPKKTTT
ncbi:hypothetical protein AX17_003344 [Amanita inopinata Kibby_2008]|nr:hypothetical protein AX17_003344 [Amanita inopinata Kibby_2008]